MASRTPWTTRRRLLGLMLCAALGAIALPQAGSDAQATSYDVHDQASFDAAIEKAKAGDVIRLAPGTYPELRVKDRRFGGTVEITGTRDAKLDGIVFDASSNILLSGITVTPIKDNKAHVNMQNGTENITIDRILLDGRDQYIGAVINTGGVNVTVKNSELTNCGQNGMCIRPGAANLQVLSNNFHECWACVFIKGGGKGAKIIGNRFDKTGPGQCNGGPKYCPHTDMIAIFGGGPWTLRSNYFGEANGAAGQIYLNPQGHEIHDVTIESNVLIADVAHGMRIGVGADSKVGHPKRVRIVNNTILSGKAGSIFLTKPWLDLPLSERPLVVNNIMFEGGDCNRGRYLDNLAVTGSACTGGEVGPANLDRNGFPTKASTRVIDKADRGYAPEYDYDGNERVRGPDRGAYEYLGYYDGGGDPGLGKKPRSGPQSKGAKIKIVAFKNSPTTPRAGRAFSLQFAVETAGGKRIEPQGASCAASVGTKNVRLKENKIRRRVVHCDFRVPSGTGGKTMRGVVIAMADGGTARKKFELRVQ